MYMARTPNDDSMRWIQRRAMENRDKGKGGAVDIRNDEVVAKWYRPGSPRPVALPRTLSRAL